jgi:hypothetical protein
MPVSHTARERITHNEVTRTLREWCQLYNLNYLTVRMRYIRGERDAEKLLRATPVPKTPIDTSKYAPKRQYLTDSTPPPFLLPLHLDDRRMILSYVGHDWDRLDTLLTKLLTEFVENDLRHQIPDVPEPQTYESTDILGGLDTELQ